MDDRKLNISARLFPLTVCALLVSLTLCCTLSVGTAYGRYSTSVKGTMRFDLQAKPRAHLLSWVDGEKSTASPEWIANENNQQMLAFCLSNSDENGENTASDDWSVRIRLYLPEPTGAQEGTDPLEDSDLRLQIDSGATEYVAVHKPLSTASALYRETGGGWIYMFTDETGEELTHILEGGKLSDLDILLIAEDGAALADYKLLIDRIDETCYALDAQTNGGANS